MSGYRVLTRSDIRERLKRKTYSGKASAIVLSLDETTSETVPFDGDLPDIPGGWVARCIGLFGANSRERFVEATSRPREDDGPDQLSAAMLSETAKTWPGLPEETFDIAGHIRVVAVDSFNKPGRKVETLAHVSRAGAVHVPRLNLDPARADDREAHARLPDGRRIAAIECDGLPRCLLQMIAGKEDPNPGEALGDIVRIPSQTTGFLPGLPTVGETKRRGRAVRFRTMTAERNARRVPVAVVVTLDDGSMRLAAESRAKNPKRKNALQALLPYPTHATNDAEVEQAVQKQLLHFDTDYLVSFDAVMAWLVAEERGTALDEDLVRRVVDMRFGGTNQANAKQVERVRRHLQTLAEIRIIVAPPEGDRVFRGPILLPTGEMLDREQEIKYGDRVTLNPDIFREMRKGRGVFVSPAYFRLDPYREDWTLRLYRYLASRWSLNGVSVAADGWSVRVTLGTALDMSGIDWRTQAVEQRRGEPHARRRLEETLADMRDRGLVGDWRIDGKGMSRTATLVVEVAADIRRAVEGSRPKVYAAAASGDLKPRRDAAKTDRPKGRSRVRARP
jgi:hypothetical protein